MDEKEKTVEDEKVEETGEAGTQASEKKDEGKAEKTYTQEEYNALDKKLKAKYEKKYSGIDIAKYNEWVESQKTAEQKQKEKETEYQKTISENQSLLQENKTLKAGVNSEDVDYVVFKVSKMEGEFEENLKQFLTDNPKYLINSSNKEENHESSINLGGEHSDKGTPDLSKMSYEEYKKYRKNNK